MNLSQRANFKEIVIAVDQFSSTLIVLSAFSAMRVQVLSCPPAFARDAGAGEGCRAKARSATAGFTRVERATARQANFKESKPQQTGTGLLIRPGEVATTSGSINSLSEGRGAGLRYSTGRK